MKKWRFVAPVAALAAVAVVAVMLVGTGAAAPTAGYKAGLVSDVGRFNDKGFNQLQLKGLKFAAAKISGLQTSAVESHSAGDYLPNFASLARKGYNIIIGAGFLLAAQEATVAKQFPNTKFAITDYDVTGPAVQRQGQERRGPDVRDAGEHATSSAASPASWSRRRAATRSSASSAASRSRRSTRSSPGTRRARRSATRASRSSMGYSQDFIDQAKCKTVAQNQIDAGSQVEFNVAGPCGLGTLDAAKEAGIWGIGVDVDQSVPRQAHPDERRQARRHAACISPSRARRTASSRVARTSSST